MKKITILMLHLRYGGIEKQTILFANQLCKKYNVEIISVYSMKEKPAYELDKKIRIKYLIDDAPNRNEFKKELKSVHLFKTLKEGKKALKILNDKKKLMIEEIKNLDCDFVLSTRIEFAELLSLYAPKHIITMTQEHNHIDTPKYIKRVQKSFCNLDYLVVLGPGSNKNYSKWLKDNKKIKIVEIPNMVEVLSKEKSKLSGNTLIAVGRMHKIKAFDDLIKVFIEVKNEIKDVKLNLIGSGEEYENLKKQAKDLNINMPGMLTSEEVKKYMLDSDIYVMTSLSECFPMVLLEASSVGLPLVSFDVPVGPKAIINDSKNGYLIPNRDIDEMAKKIVYLLKNRETMNKMGSTSYNDAKKYLPVNVMKKWYEIFDSKEK